MLHPAWAGVHLSSATAEECWRRPLLARPCFGEPCSAVPAVQVMACNPADFAAGQQQPACGLQGQGLGVAA